MAEMKAFIMPTTFASRVPDLRAFRNVRGVVARGMSNITVSRRGFLGVLAAGLTVPRTAGKSCILLLNEGGMSQVDTFAPKPDTLGARPYGTMHDRAFFTLIADLDERGLLATTLVAALTEFGRTPWRNADGGRDHWAGCWSVCFAGGGVVGGRAIGSSDELGAYPAERLVEPRHLIATIHKALGLATEQGCEPISELF